MIKLKVIHICPVKKKLKKIAKMAMVPDIVKNMESYLEEEGTSRRSKNYFRFKGFLEIKGLLLTGQLPRAN